MTKWRFGLLLVLGVIAFMPSAAYAEESKPAAAIKPLPVSEQEKEFGKKFLPMTKSFGFSEYVFSAKTPGGMLLYEYLQPGHKLENWQFLATVSLLPAGKTMEDGNKAMIRFMDFFKKQLSKIHEQKEYDAAFGKIYYTSYEVGTGKMTENNLSAVWQVAPGLVINFQIQKRGGAHIQGAADTFKNYLTAMAEKSKEAKQ